MCSSPPRTSAGASRTPKSTCAPGGGGGGGVGGGGLFGGWGGACVYLRAARGLGHEPARCLVFEDALVGVRAARSAGMRVIGVSTAHTEIELCAAGAERAIDHFEGLTWPA
jgi:hypothetical protein